jgi:hypothetical protein
MNLSAITLLLPQSERARSFVKVAEVYVGVLIHDLAELSRGTDVERTWGEGRPGSSFFVEIYIVVNENRT